MNRIQFLMMLIVINYLSTLLSMECGAGRARAPIRALMARELKRCPALKWTVLCAKSLNRPNSIESIDSKSNFNETQLAPQSFELFEFFKYEESRSGETTVSDRAASKHHALSEQTINQVEFYFVSFTNRPPDCRSSKVSFCSWRCRTRIESELCRFKRSPFDWDVWKWAI